MATTDPTRYTDTSYKQRSGRIMQGKSLHNITRMDYAKAKGWWVRVIKDNVQYSKLFSDGRNSGADNALQAAIDYRDKLLEELFGSATPSRSRPHTSNIQNTSGVIGVSHNMRLKRNKYIEESWIASWMEQGKQRKKSFSVKKHGYEGAVKLACELREDMCRKHQQPQRH